jgi:hypothetical protein
LREGNRGSVYRYQKALSGTLRAFFDRRLRGREGMQVEEAAGEYPEAEVIGRGG